MESGTGPTKAPSRPHIAILNIVGVIALLDELVVRGSVRAREGFVLRSAELQPTYVAMSFLFSFFFFIFFIVVCFYTLNVGQARKCRARYSAGVCLFVYFFSASFETLVHALLFSQRKKERKKKLKN